MCPLPKKRPRQRLHRKAWKRWRSERRHVWFEVVGHEPPLSTYQPSNFDMTRIEL